MGEDGEPEARASRLVLTSVGRSTGSYRRVAAVVEEEQADPSAWRRPVETRHGDGRGNGCSAVFEQGQGKVPVQA